jgi:MSHA pilin protein MshD
MSKNLSRPRSTCRARIKRQRGLSLIELVIFVVVVSAALAGVLRVFMQSGASSADPQIHRQALAIAESLMQEVQMMPFTFCEASDANVETATSTGGCASTVEAIGPEAGETRFGSPQFDNVNDYHGYSMSGIVDISNAAVSGLASYSASITVANAALSSITSGSGNALLITVTVNGPGATQVTLNGYRSRYAPNAAL